MKVDWDVTRYADRLPRVPPTPGTMAAQNIEDRLRRRYAPRDDPAAEVPISRPCIVVDARGIILAWHLPGILKESRQVSCFTLFDCGIKYNVFQSEMLAAAKKLLPLLDRRQTGASWRVDPQNFPPKIKDAKGVVDISPAWFQQGQEV